MNTETRASCGALLKAHRLAAGLTQERLAARAGVSRRSVQALEHDESAPQRHTLQRLLAALGLTVEERASMLAVAPPARRRPRAGVGPPARRAPPLLLPVTPLLGRTREVATLSDLLRRPEARLLTLTGVGGIGKTRLALAVADELRARFAQGVWLVELAPLTDPALVPREVAAALGLSEQPGTPLLRTLSAHLRSHHALLLLDNCEHVIAECALLCAALLPECPHLRILATSREALGVAGEYIFSVPPLAVPARPAALPALADLPGYGAVALFVERAAAVTPRFALTRANAATVVEIVQRLDGLPLAIELAAARTPVLAVAQIVARLDDRFRLLTNGRRGAPARHQTLRAALDWSYALLSADERRLLRRLSVCVGGFTLALVEAVGAGDSIAATDVLDLLAGLVAKSLAQVEEEVAGEARYGLLETVRQYAAEQLALRQEEEAGTRDRHLEWCLALAKAAEPRLTGPEQRLWLERLEREHDNLRAALRWAFGPGQESSAIEQARRRGGAGSRLATALWRFWQTRGYLSEGRAWLEAALRHTAAEPAARAAALFGAGNLAFVQGDFAQAQSLYDESLALHRVLADNRGIATILNGLGAVAESRGDYEQAQALHEESLALHEESLSPRQEPNDLRAMASTLTKLGLVTIHRGDLPRARALFTRGLALARQLGDTGGTAMALNNLGVVAYLQGEYGQARELYGECLAVHRALGDMWCVAGTLINLGAVVHAQGDDAQAQALLRESLTLAQALGATREIAECLEMLADIAVGQGRPRRAGRLLGAAAALRTALDAPLNSLSQAAIERTRAVAREALGADEYAVAWMAGQALSLEQAIAEALAETS